MSNKTLAILSYITIIGWLIAYFKSKDHTHKNDVVTYHLEQGLGFFIVSIVLNILLSVITSIVPSLYFINIIGIVLLIIWIIGIVHAANEEKKPIPLIGKIFEGQFGFLHK
ncbi:putative membrane protein [Chryseobacterium sp. SORGH_AS 447]|uniref:DUF4870 domain-containing protein n=1 Tax=Chryseobacterium sp. SORGH_AS_0447 TaxID=3041769 RepID=UPI002785096E|nr:DUF4870 domain-containing protein [Chryseobacterium sp. SORGH_AS_0447]MDQ1162396.1 putative membrane protein [Chryseobacterium sp. SORGH_AS_0447]